MQCINYQVVIFVVLLPGLTNPLSFLSNSLLSWDRIPSSVRIRGGTFADSPGSSSVPFVLFSLQYLGKEKREEKAISKKEAR